MESGIDDLSRSSKGRFQSLLRKIFILHLSESTGTHQLMSLKKEYTQKPSQPTFSTKNTRHCVQLVRRALTLISNLSLLVFNFIQMLHILRISERHPFTQCICILGTSLSTFERNLRNSQLIISLTYQRYLIFYIQSSLSNKSKS